MSSFWDLSDNTNAASDVKTDYEVPGGNMDPIPDNSDVLAEVKEAKWVSKGEGGDAVRYINIQWKVEAPDSVKNRVVFQKLWVDDLDPSSKDEAKAKTKRDKARRMLATIDANSRGKLMSSADRPTDDSLALALNGARMVIKCMVWEMPDREHYGEFIRGNWISAVKPKTSDLHVSVAKPAPKAPASGGQTSGSFDLEGDDIPF